MTDDEKRDALDLIDAVADLLPEAVEALREAVEDDDLRRCLIIARTATGEGMAMVASGLSGGVRAARSVLPPAPLGGAEGSGAFVPPTDPASPAGVGAG